MQRSRTGRTRRSAGLAALVASVSLVAACGPSARHLAGEQSSPPPTQPHASSPVSPPTSPETSPPPSPGLPPGFGGGPPGSGLARFYHQSVTWHPCGTDSCASIWVPLDYAHPDGQAITIEAKRQLATDPAGKRGTLFINPGGPGASGVDYLSYIGLDASITNVYDIVGFDPRGVGGSTPVTCESAHDIDVLQAADPSPDTPAEIARMSQLWAQFTAGCVARSGPLLAHVSTIEAARDMDILRALVGDPKLNYYGASYGTYLGATYAALFPTHVGRMVLDGAVDPAATPHQSEINQAAGFQTALTAYLQDCVRGGSCPLGTTVAAAQQRLIALFRSTDAHPLPTSSSRMLTEGLAFYGFVVPLYSRGYWSYETAALAQALQGNGDDLLALSDQYADRNPEGGYQDNEVEASPAVSCLDHPEHETIAQIEAGKAAFLRASPVFGPVAAWFPYSCSNWPVTSSLPTPNYAAPGAPPIVVVGTTRDPATPYQQAVNLARELDSGVLLTRDGDGHTAYSSGNTCIDQAVDTFFTSGTTPTTGTVCR